MRTGRRLHKLSGLALAAGLVAALGCRPLVGIRATVRLDERTRLEREVLGDRGEARPVQVLLSPGGEGLRGEELRELEDEHEALGQRLAAMPRHDAETRAWQVIALHNGAVLRARRGDADGAAGLLDEAVVQARAYGLSTLEWQALLTRAELKGEPDDLKQAAEVLLGVPPLTQFDHALEDPQWRGHLYAGLVSAALDAGDAEQALRYADEHQAVELARAVPPGGLALPPGELRERARALEAARSAAAKARDDLCRLSPDDAQGAARQPFEAALVRLKEQGQEFAESSAAGGLFAPEAADLYAVQELLPDDAALLVYEPVGDDRYAAFVLAPEAFRAQSTRVASQAVSGASVTRALEGALSEDAAQEAAGALLGPFAAELGKGVRRVYLCCPPELSGLAWEGLPWEGTALAERFELVFLGGLSDLRWAFGEKGYGRGSALVCHPAGADVEVARAALEASNDWQRVSVFSLPPDDRAALSEALALADVVWFLSPLELSSAEPAASYLAGAGGLGRLSGLSLGEVAALRTGASCAAFGSVQAGAFGPGLSPAMRVVTRALMAAGVPSVVYSVGAERAPEGGMGYWREFFRGVRRGPVSSAHQKGLLALPAACRPAFRLYGFAGMDEAEYREFSSLEFSDLARRASGHMDAGRFREAAGDLLSLERMGQVVPLDSQAERLRLLAQVEGQLVRCFHMMGDYEAAARHQRLLIEHLQAGAEPNGPQTAAAHQSLGALLTEWEHYGEAEEAYARCIALLRDQGTEERLAEALGELGKSQDRAAQYERAVATFAEALDKYRQLGQPAGMAAQHQRIGAIYLVRLNNAPRAEEQFREARRLFESVGRGAEVIETAIDIALCRRALGDLSGGLDLLTQALEGARQRSVRATEARALTEIANTHWLRGEYQQALELVGLSNEIAAELDLPFRLNTNYQLLGLIYWELNQYDRALRALDTAVEAALRARMPLEVASAFNNRGIVHRRRGQYEEALDSFRQALAVDTRLGTRWGLGYDHRNIGITLRLMGRLEEASGHLERAVALCREIEDRVNLAKALLALGELHLDQDRAQEARPLLEEALGQAQAMRLPEVEWRALRELGQISLKGGDREAALAAFERGIKVVEDLRGAIKVEELQSGFLEDKADLYEDLVALLLDMGRAEEAFEYSERSRARKFLDILAGQRFELKTERERQLYARQEELARQMRALQETEAREEDAQRRAELARELDGARRQYADVLVDIRIANPALSSFVSVAVVPAPELAESVPRDVALVVYYMLPRELAIWVIRNGRVEVRRVQVARDDLTERIRAYRLMVQERAAVDEVKAASRELNRLLVEPVADLIEGSAAACIVPHRGLHYLSFASLYDGEAFLVERCPLFYAPSASALRRALEAEAPAAKDGLQVLAVGNPAVGDPAYDLPFSEREVASLQRDFVNVTALTGERATEDWVRENIGRFDVVHIGAHGQFDPVNPLFSSLMLAPSKDDGLLQLHEVTGLRINARLVTLSACQSGVGDLRSGDELVSLARAFSYAGTRAVMSTLWRVDDVSTALVSKHFYRFYVNEGAAASLRRAQLQVMNDGRHYHPVYWAGVVLTGDYR